MQVTFTIPTPFDLVRRWRWSAIVILVLAFALIGGGGKVFAAESVTTPDTGLGGVALALGGHVSLTLDASGNPVASYHDASSGDLTVMHCNDINCAGVNESITTPDTGGDVGPFSSLALDASGNPVVSYMDNTNGDLKVLHCNDANCAAGGDSITSPDTGGSVGTHTSLALDAGGNPVVSYYDGTNVDLKILHCNDANCAAGGDSITSPDTGGSVGQYTSLALAAGGNPVVSYYDVTNGDLKVLHCNDANCAPGGDSITSPDSGGDVGQSTSLGLDATGNPVVSYYDNTNDDLKVLHCNDANCAAGGDSVTSPDTAGNVGGFSSLALDAAGNPVVSYADLTNTDLKVLHCNDANCAAGGDSITSPDSGSALIWSSLALDGAGNPVAGYYDLSPVSDLKVLHCNDPDCSGAAKLLPINITSIGQYVLPKTCFQIRNPAQVPYFQVCDNDFAGVPELDPICLLDGVCGDDDPAAGSIRVPVLPGDYRVAISMAAPEHVADASIEVCTNAAPVGGENCTFTFTSTPKTRPWFPWDLVGTSGPSGPLDGKVTVADILAVVQKYGQQKPLP